VTRKSAHKTELGILRAQADASVCRIHWPWRQSEDGNRTARRAAIAVEPRATMHVTDDLLRLSAAAVPLIASTVTGTFLFVNRSGRRIERLRALVEVHTSLPAHLNPNHALQRAILWQLWEVELWVSPWFRLVKLYLYLTGVLFLLLCVEGAFPKALGIPHDLVDAIRWICVGLTVVGPIPPYAAYRRHRHTATLPYRQAIKNLDSINGPERAPIEWRGVDSNQLERSVIADTIEAFDTTHNGRTTAKPAESSAKQATNDRIADSTERE
jgi:hypothetical protein